ncbi:MAG TPA: hypothetical protein VMW56_04340 [Candidatus Margulisiibacteriota bacterium]|nr:hypothetical protein [Candidatus Margulisiibacteriota bacterium]
MANREFSVARMHRCDTQPAQLDEPSGNQVGLAQRAVEGAIELEQFRPQAQHAFKGARRTCGTL